MRGVQGPFRSCLLRHLLSTLLVSHCKGFEGYYSDSRNFPDDGLIENEDDQSQRDSDQASVVRLEYEGIYSELRAACAGQPMSNVASIGLDGRLIADMRGDSGGLISRDTSPQPTRMELQYPPNSSSGG